MFGIFGLIAFGCLAGAYFTRGLNRVMFILLALAIVQLKSIALGAKLFSFTVIIIAVIYFFNKSLTSRRK